MLFALSLLVALSPPLDEPPTIPEARTDLVAAFHALFAAPDSDHDGQLSRAEWSAAFDGTRGSNSAADRAIPIRMSFNAPPDEVFLDMDRNGDGLLSFEEFAHDPLARFDCLDADHDGIVLPAENEAERERCIAVQTPTATAEAPAR